MLDSQLKISVKELCELERIENEVVTEIVEYGISRPVEGSGTADWIFKSSSVHWIKKAVRLHQDLEIDWLAVSVVIDLLKQKEALEKQNAYYQSQLKRFIEN